MQTHTHPPSRRCVRLSLLFAAFSPNEMPVSDEFSRRDELTATEVALCVVPGTFHQVCVHRQSDGEAWRGRQLSILTEAPCSLSSSSFLFIQAG